MQQNRFTTGEGAYQLFQLFRANLAAFLAEKSLQFWMIQSDTYWRANLFDRADPDLHMNYTDELLFDREGSSGLLADMIAGGNFFVKGTQKTTAFFERVSETLQWLYSTDNNLMGALCAHKFADLNCAFIPYGYDLHELRTRTFLPSRLLIAL